MKDTFDYENNLCYRYDKLLFYGIDAQQYVDYHQKHPAKDCRDLELVENGFCVDCCKVIDPDTRQKQPTVNNPNPNDDKNITKYCEDICKNDNGEPSKASFAAVVPIEAPTGFNRFNICQNDTCVEAGTLGTFGKAPDSSNDYEWLRPSLIDDKYYRLVETDITDVIAKQGWSLSEPFVVRMVETLDNTWGMLPDPVFIEKRLGKEFLI